MISFLNSVTGLDNFTCGTRRLGRRRRTTRAASSDALISKARMTLRMTRLRFLGIQRR